MAIVPPMLLLTLLACGGAPAPETPLLERFDASPAAVIAELVEATPGAERDAAIMRLLNERPTRTSALCEALEAGPLRQRCEAVNSRPHLRAAAVDAQGEAGPRPRHPELSEATLSRWEDHPPDPGACAEADHRCLSVAAVGAAEARDPALAAARCSADPTPRWRQECFFKAAEAVATQDLAVALELCRGAGTYAVQCVGHAFMGQLDPEQAPTLARGPEVAEIVRETLPASPGAVDYWWCVYAHRLAELDPARLVAGLEGLPPEAGPHLRSAIALASLGAAAPEAAFQAALSQGEPPPPLRIDPERDAPGQAWRRDKPGEQAIPSIPFRHTGSDRRPWSEDPALDARLAWLSALGAAAEQSPEPYVVALSDPEPLVRWTAARLLVRLDPEHPALAEAAEDEDPLVRGRAAPGVGRHPSPRREPHE